MATKSLVTFAADRPKTFKKTVSIPVAGAESFDIEFEFKNLTKREEAAVRDAAVAASEGKKDSDKPITWAGLADSSIGNDVAFFMSVTVGWKAPNDVPFSRDAFDQLLDEYRGAGEVIGEAFNAGIKGGAAGN